MKLTHDTHKKMMSVYQLLSQDSLSLGSLEHATTLLYGIHPDLDEKLSVCEEAISKLQNVLDGDIVTLSAGNLPEENEKQKKRKKTLIFFIGSIKNLQGEIKRIDAEFSSPSSTPQNTLWHMGKVIKYAKGPFGIVTLAALIIVGIGILFMHGNQKQSPVASSQKNSIQVITYQGKEIPLTQFFVGHGPDCDSPHYHAPHEETVTALDGTIFQDPGGCGFGKVKDMQITTVEK